MSTRKPDEGRYSRVSRRVWASTDFRALSAPKPNAQTLWLRLLCGPELGPIPGLFEVRESGLAEALGWPVAAFRARLKEITDRGMATFDKPAGLMWVPRAIRHNPPDNPNVIVGWKVAWKDLPECHLKDTARVAINAWCVERGDSWVKAFAQVTPNPSVKGFTEPLPPWSAQQDSDSETEKETENGSPPEGSTPETPEPASLAERAKSWLAQADAGGGKGRSLADMTFGDPAKWPESKGVCSIFASIFQRRDDPRHSGDPRARVLVERFAEGYSPEDLYEAIGGATCDPNISENKQFQTLKTILRDAAQVDKFRALAPRTGPSAPPDAAQAEKLSRALEADNARREAEGRAALADFVGGPR